jgi:hypothetical protein
VAWFDLLGYGQMLREAAFDPTDETTQAAIERINNFHSIVEQKTCKFLMTLLLNDGGAAHRDLSPRSRSVTYDFIRRLYDLHSTINEKEKMGGFPGVRTVVAAGFRVRRKNSNKQKLLDGFAARLVKKVKSGQISILEGINNAVTVKPFSAAVPELQANFAFSKAYLAESSGSKAGLAGPRLFLDGLLIREPAPTGISLSKPISWSYPGLSSTFFSVDGVDSEAAAKDKYSGFCNAFEVAMNISASSEIIERLKSLRTSNAKDN